MNENRDCEEEWIPDDDSGFWFFVPNRKIFAEMKLFFDIQDELEGDEEE